MIHFSAIDRILASQPRIEDALAQDPTATFRVDVVNQIDFWVVEGADVELYGTLPVTYAAIRKTVQQRLDREGNPKLNLEELDALQNLRASALKFGQYPDQWWGNYMTQILALVKQALDRDTLAPYEYYRRLVYELDSGIKTLHTITVKGLHRSRLEEGIKLMELSLPHIVEMGAIAQRIDEAEAEGRLESLIR